MCLVNDGSGDWNKHRFEIIERGKFLGRASDKIGNFQFDNLITSFKFPNQICKTNLGQQFSSAIGIKDILKPFRGYKREKNLYQTKCSPNVLQKSKSYKNYNINEKKIL